MSQPFSHTKLLDISSYLDIPNELINLPASSEQTILIVGPDLVRREVAPSKGYMERLLERMVEWCIQEKIIQDQDIIQDLHTLLQNGALVPLAFRIEEYLATKHLKEQCLRAVLFSDNQVRRIHRDLVRVPHRGYVTTSYDTCIETKYAQCRCSTLPTFYPSSIAQAIKASQKKQPFILKLYGDIDDPDSIKPGHRLLKGLYTEDVREQLRQLFSEAPATFIGFNQTDEDFIALQSLVKDGYIVYQNQPTSNAEQGISDYLLELNYYAKGNLETLSHNEVLLAVNTPLFKEKKPEKQATIITPSTPPAPVQNNHSKTQQKNKKVIDVCIFYDSKDKKYKDDIEEVLDGLKRKVSCFGIEYIAWAMGSSLDYKIGENPLMSKQLVILLISSAFLARYNEEQMERVADRHEKKALISPILVRDCDWEGHKFMETLKDAILPEDHVAISASNKRKDVVYKEISKCLYKALDKLA